MLEDELKTYASNWAVLVVEDGEEVIKRRFLRLIRKAVSKGLPVTNTYPDGSLLAK